MDYAILGPLRLGQQAEQTLPPKEAQLLAALLVRAGQPVSTDTLIDVLWPEHAPPTVHTSLQVHVSQLRKRIGAARVVTAAQTYRLEIGADVLDAHRFRDAVLSADEALQHGRHASAALLAQGALTLWRGRPVPELDNWPEAIQFGQEHEELRALAIELKAESELALGLHNQVATTLTAATKELPNRERLCRLLAVALYRCDRQVDALHVLQSLRSFLSEEFGVEVSAETRKLETDILRQDPALDPPIPPAESASLPTPPTPTFGRDQDIASALDSLTRGARLLTLTGPGGIGKTRLALEVARALLDRAGGPVDFVDLSAVMDHHVVAARIADQFEPRRAATSDPVDVVAGRYHGGGILVLDNMEQILGAANDVATLLERAPSLRIITTSRAALRLRIETVQPVAPLAVVHESESTEPAAVAMFRDRTDAGRGSHPWSEAEEQAARDLVALVDGLPLAIELAAARCRLLGPRALLTRLHASMAVLADGPTDLPARQRSLHQTIQWSVDLLKPEQRKALGSLGVFWAGFDVPAAVTVLEYDELSTLATLEALSDASLLRVSHDTEGEPVFSMLQVIKAHTPTLLTQTELDAARDRHAAWVVDLAQSAEPLLRSEQAGTWLNRLNRQREDISAAVARLCETHRANDATDLMHALVRYWLSTAGNAEGSRLVDSLLNEDALTSESLGRVLRMSARLYERRGEYAKAAEQAARSADLGHRIGNRAVEAQAYSTLASSTLWMGRPDEAERYWEQTLALTDRTEETEFRVLTLGNLGLLALDQGDFQKALDIYESVLGHLEELGLVDAVTDTLMNLAWAHLGLGQFDSARDCLRRSKAGAVSQGDTENAAYHLLGVARLASLTSDHRAALQLAAAATSMLAAAGQVFEPFEISVAETITAESSAALGVVAADIAGWPILTLEDSLALTGQILGEPAPAGDPGAG